MTVGSAKSESEGGPEIFSYFFFFGFASTEKQMKAATMAVSTRPSQRLFRDIIIDPFKKLDVSRATGHACLVFRGVYPRSTRKSRDDNQRKAAMVNGFHVFGGKT